MRIRLNYQPTDKQRMFHGSTAVSYTHLDVYKRQGEEGREEQEEQAEKEERDAFGAQAGKQTAQAARAPG